MRSSSLVLLLSSFVTSAGALAQSAATHQASWAPVWDQVEGMDQNPPEPIPVRRRDEPPIAHVQSLPSEADLLSRAKKDASGQLTVEVPGPNGTETKVMTVDALLQQALAGILESYAPPYAAVVAIEPGTGRVLAMAEHSQAQPKLRGLPTQAIFPAASIFKLVTSAALLDVGVTADATECFHGGKRRLSWKQLVDSTRDQRCTTLASALGMSANVVFAKMTLKYLTPDRLRTWADAFHFNKPFDFPIPTDISSALVPADDELAFAQTGAGFGDVFMSPLHAAAMASVAANRGQWRDPVLFEDAVAADQPGVQVMTPEQAKALEGMMEETITHGTARKIFRERGMRVPGAVGKTGSLADRKPFRDYTWFVGYAPRDNPRIAVAAVIVNDMVWRIRAAWLGREAMRLYLTGKKGSAPAPTAGSQTN